MAQEILFKRKKNVRSMLRARKQKNVRKRTVKERRNESSFYEIDIPTVMRKYVASKLLMMMLFGKIREIKNTFIRRGKIC